MKIKNAYIIHDGGLFYGVMETKESRQETQRFNTHKEANDVLTIWIEAEEK